MRFLVTIVCLVSLLGCKGKGGTATPPEGGEVVPPAEDAGNPSDGGAPGDAGTSFTVDGGWPWANAPTDPCAPTPPQAMPELSVPPHTRTVTVAAGDNLQTALDNAAPGDELVLPAGATFSGSFRLNPKTGTGVITVRSSESDQLPLHTRVDPTRDAAHFARILANTNGVSALEATTGAAHWRFIGIEVGIKAGVDPVTNLVLLGDATQTTASELPNDIVIDRCWVHGNDTGNARRGIALNGNAIAVIDSVVENFHEVGADSQALCGWNGAGPFAIINNYLEGAAETVLFGGADPAVPNLVPSDIAVLHNTISKRQSWKQDDPSYAGTAYVVKNTFELKNARRVWIEGNIIEKAWPMGQVGYALVLTPRNQGGTADWSAVQDVMLRNNLIQKAAGGLSLLSADDTNPSAPTLRIRAVNNLFTQLGGQWGTGTKLFQFLHGTATGSCIDFEHLTSDQDSTLASVGDTGIVADQFTFSNNVVSHGTYGFIGNATAEGTAALNTFFTNWSFEKNVIYGGGSPTAYPPNNAVISAQSGVGFVDAGTGDFHLASTSAYKGGATDGGDPGVDLDALNAAIQ